MTQEKKTYEKAEIRMTYECMEVQKVTFKKRTWPKSPRSYIATDKLGEKLALFSRLLLPAPLHFSSCTSTIF